MGAGLPQPCLTRTAPWLFGTHVAATIAGTGAAADGQRNGVAFDAALLNAKVLDDTGSGFESGVIAGMEWAAAHHARVANLSLGGESTDGGDPLSQALDRLTTTSGTLFVVAAGNGGPDPRTISSPGTADAALTVGAVDAHDQLAEFSSRGPRQGDYHRSGLLDQGKVQVTLSSVRS